ncbi:unnamed protein product [Vitrella brassicaformis CCMP3155]|uniref:MYND-type domain-containing protein n=1 Tax=Vitrella brassicaformis (strain CCMP3155) TaxID=1169540 RepID=A0A0G4EER7_VITBC|nr:unnamed protein product [Vitrella brassicaformis CCMP3155]|eukprot:CEL93868.1 unnamed protein product [Vitrella brassicaformis CCMP3155]
MSAIPVNLLARPKGETIRLECELCGRPASLQCKDVPTYYCTPEHFEQDWRGILHLIGQDLTLLRSKPKMIGSEEERQKREKELRAIRKEVLDLCTETAQKFLVQGNYQLAVPGALHSLKLAIATYGSEALELVPSYLLLAEANLGLRRLKVAEEFLSLANWSLVKHPEAGPALMSNLQRNFGRLYAAQQRYNESLEAFASDIYYSACEFGPQSVRTAPSYFHMARVFQSHQQLDRAHALYNKVLQIYNKWLNKALPAPAPSPTQEDHTQGAAAAVERDIVEELERETGDDVEKIMLRGKGEEDRGERGAERPESDALVSEVEMEEAAEILRHISEHRGKRFGDMTAPTAEARCTLGLLFLHAGDYKAAREQLNRAVDGFSEAVGDANRQTLNAMRYFRLAEQRLLPATL